MIFAGTIAFYRSQTDLGETNHLQSTDEELVAFYEVNMLDSNPLYRPTLLLPIYEGVKKCLMPKCKNLAFEHSRAGVYNILLLPASLLLLIWRTAANEFQLYLWDTTKCQPTQKTFKHKLRIHSIILVTSPSRLLRIVSTDVLALRLFCFKIYAGTAAKSYILNYIWTAANFIIEGRMRPYGCRCAQLFWTLFKTFYSFDY